MATADRAPKSQAADAADGDAAKVVVAASKKPTLTPVLNRMGPRGIPLLAVTKAATDDAPAEVVHEATLITLPSGLSFVPTPEWTRAKQHKNLAIALKQRIRGTRAPEWAGFAVGQNVLVEFPPVDAADPLGKMSETEAIEYLDDIIDASVLRQLERLEKRDKVIIAMRDRRKTIETQGVSALDDQPDRAVLEEE